MLELLAVVFACAGEPVTTRSLLAELADPLAIARYPDPPFRLLQSSSYDRATTTPADATTWFANDDCGKFLRVDTHDGRSESVMLDAKGPGAVVRLWSPNPKGILRIYLDDAAKPVLEAPMSAVLDGTTYFGDATQGFPLAGSQSRGWNLFVPVPFAKHCVITTDNGAGVYYQVNWREYAKDVKVTPFTLKDVPAVGSTPFGPTTVRSHGALSPSHAQTLTADERAVIVDVSGSSGCIDLLSLDLYPASPADDLSSVVLQATFDGEQTVYCPLTELVSWAPGAAMADARRAAATGFTGSFTADLRWPMPFQSSARIEITNYGKSTVAVQANVHQVPWAWNARSMHFHATWQRAAALHTRPMRDFNFVTVTGQGVYAGDSLHVVNPVDAWWGEGDEKIYVDGESFPSHIGTGTEDYYGYGWCCPQPFSHPLHSQTVCDGRATNSNFGRTIVCRLRGLDGVPFKDSLRMDMEVWHWAECDIAYAPTTFWYAKPGATCNVRPDLQEVRRGRIDPPKPYKIAGALECEDLEISMVSEGTAHEVQSMRSFGQKAASGERQLWVRASKPDDFVELVIPAPGPGPQRVTLYATKSWDYGIVHCRINGKDAGPPSLDLCSEKEGTVLPTGPIDLGVHMPVGNTLFLRVTVIGANPKSTGTHSFFGLDAVMLSPAPAK